MIVNPSRFGQESENIAAEFLSRRGYRIVERNVRTRVGEMDIVAYDGSTLVFVEVKARRTNAFGGAIHSIDQRKRRRLELMARQYLSIHRLKDQDCRFDLVFIHTDREEKPVVELIQNDFEGEFV